MGCAAWGRVLLWRDLNNGWLIYLAQRKCKVWVAQIPANAAIRRSFRDRLSSRNVDCRRGRSIPGSLDLQVSNIVPLTVTVTVARPNYLHRKNRFPQRLARANVAARHLTHESTAALPAVNK